MLDHETLSLFLDTINRFVDDVLIPSEPEVSDTDHIPAAIIQQMREMGLFGLSIPEEFGGLG